MQLLWAALRRAAQAAGVALVRLGAWPAGREFAVLLSHDVDLWRKRTMRQLAKELLRSATAPSRLGSVAGAFCRGPDPWSDLEGIADLEAARGMHSTFFLLPGRPDRQVGGVRVVGGYPADDQAVAAAARRLVERGCEIGLHSSFDSSCSAEALAAERADVARLANGAVDTCRQHFLRFERPATWRSQVEAGLTCDATLGHHDQDGYRAGFSFPFHPFDGAELPLLELPLVVMDGVLLECQALDAEAAWERTRSYLERTRADGALCSLLWHNHYFCELDAPGYRGVYERALDWVRDHGGWGASAREIAAWWRRRAGVGIDVGAEGGRTRVTMTSEEPLPHLCLEVHHAPGARVEVPCGDAVEQGDGLVRCVASEWAGGRSELVLRTG
jgi:peptidoglycan/xylan/chitin deacetylase (PgdA/CDA1 family)